MARSSRQQPPAPAAHMGTLGVVARLTWLMVGNVALLVLALLIGRAGLFSVLDVAFWLVAGGLVIVRYLDITRLNGQTKDGEPATVMHWRRYVAYLLLASGVLWSAAHALGMRAP